MATTSGPATVMCLKNEIALKSCWWVAGGEFGAPTEDIQVPGNNCHCAIFSSF